MQPGEETSDQHLRKAVGSRVPFGSLSEAETPPSPTRPWCTCPRRCGGVFWFSAPATLEASRVGPAVKNPPANARDRRGFSPWVGKIPWRRAWQPPPVFLPGKCHGQRSLADCSPWGRKESDTTEPLTLSLSSRGFLNPCLVAPPSIFKASRSSSSH